MGLATTIVMDYQNVHLVGHEAFPNARFRPKHECLIDPLRFAQTLLEVRNSLQREGYSEAHLARVLVYRGLPSPKYDAKSYDRSQSQKAHWERDPRVEVTLRPLTYRVERDSQGNPVLNADGSYRVLERREKGVDVLCALAAVREARRPDVNLVILASHDTDLEPAIIEARRDGHAKVEAFRWSSPDGWYVNQLGKDQPRDRKIWVSRLDETAFQKSWDLTPYG